MLNTSKKIDGIAMANRWLDQLRQIIIAENLKARLHIIITPGNEVSEYYVALKERRGLEIGLDVVVHRLSAAANTAKVIDLINSISKDRGGLIVQLPLPEKFDKNAILNSIPPEIDVDWLNRQIDNPFYTQPVVGAVSKALEAAGYDIAALKELPKAAIHVVGNGFLVGQPTIAWLENLGIEPVIYDKGDDLYKLRQAKIIISGTGVAGLIQPDMVSAGVVLIDAGTSSDSGELAGDIDPDCYQKASFYTPVPGGIGSLTLAQLFQNTIDCARQV